MYVIKLNYINQQLFGVVDFYVSVYTSLIGHFFLMSLSGQSYE